MKTSTLLALILAALLCACATRGEMRPAPPAFPLLAPATFGRAAQFEQVLHAAYGAQEATLQCLVAIDAQRLTVIGLTATGQRVFTLDYDGQTLKAERSPLAPSEVQPGRILADLQLALWPLETLQAAATGTAWQVSEPRPGLRRLRHADQLVAEVHRAGPDRLWLSALAAGYALDIQTREVAP